MRKRRHRSPHTAEIFSKHVRALTLFAAVLILAGSLLTSNKQPAFTSAEVHFADASPSGLQIMPASCASSVEHWDGECSMPIDCTITVTPSTMSDGQYSTVQIDWQAPRPPDSYDSRVSSITGLITGIGSVYQSGTLDVAAPHTSMTYEYTGKYKDYDGTTLGTFSCSAPLTVSNPGNPLYINVVEINGGEGVASGSIINYPRVTVGDTVKYRMFVANNSTWQTQTNVHVTGAIPAGTHLAWQGGGMSSSGSNASSVWWDQSSIGPNASGYYVDFHVDVDDGSETQICNTATVSSTQWPSAIASPNTVCNPVQYCTVPLPSAPPTFNSDDGYKVPSVGSGGSVGKQANVNTSPICVRNDKHFNYFFPTRTSAEVNAFKANPPPLVSFGDVANAPTAGLTANGSAQPITVNVGDTVDYVFSNSNCTSVSRTVLVDGQGAWLPWGNPSTCSTTADSGEIGPDQAGHTYELKYTVTGPGGTQSATVTVIVRALTTAPTASISASRTPIILGEHSALTWNSTNADFCEVSDNGLLTLSGTSGTNYDIAPGETTTYYIECGNEGPQRGYDSVEVTVNQPPPPTANLTANGYSSITANVNTWVRYDWSSANTYSGDAGASSRAVVSPSNCPYGGAWIINGTNGSNTGSSLAYHYDTRSTVFDQAGCTYNITFYVEGPGGVDNAPITVYVPPSLLAARGDSNGNSPADAAYSTSVPNLRVGDYIWYKWKSHNCAGPYTYIYIRWPNNTDLEIDRWADGGNTCDGNLSYQLTSDTVGEYYLTYFQNGASYPSPQLYFKISP